MDDWSLERVEGGLNPFIVNSDELIHDFNTLGKKILIEGIRLYGKDLNDLESKIKENDLNDKSDLIDLVKSL